LRGAKAERNTPPCEWAEVKVQTVDLVDKYVIKA
jgi:hypothetical protein